MSGWLTNGMSLATLPLTGNERFPVDTQLTAGANPEMEAVSLSQAASIMGGQLPMQPARFYGLPNGNTPGTFLTVTATLYAYPYYIAAPTLIKTIGVYTTTGQTGGLAHAGLYADNGAGYPGTLVSGSDGAALSCASAAASQTNTVNLTLQAGWYWLASIFTASSTFPTMAAATAVYPSATVGQLGFDTAAHLIATSAQAPTGITVAATYGTLLSIGATFPTGAAVNYNAAIPLVTLST